jgi:7-keto-8-aminopelargonate synthetase-like enzyme
MNYTLSHQPGRWMFREGVPFLYFSGTGYLGMAHDPLFHETLHSSINQYGSNFGSSRIGSMRLAVYEETEEILARFLGQTAALTVSSGTLAGILAYRVFDSKGELVFAPNTHPALWLQLPQPFKSRAEWEETCIQKSYQAGPPLFMFSNAIDSLQVIPYHFDWLGQLGNKRELILVLDESHTLGIWGEQGAGVLPALNLPAHVQSVMVGSMGKAMGIPAGFIAGDDSWVREIWNGPHFGGASPAPPAYLDAWNQLQSHFLAKRTILVQNIRLFETLSEQKKSLLRTIPDYPVFFLNSEHLYHHLFQNHIFISRFPYPTPLDQPVTRIVLSALHLKEDIQKLSHTLLTR